MWPKKYWPHLPIDCNWTHSRLDMNKNLSLWSYKTLNVDSIKNSFIVNNGVTVHIFTQTLIFFKDLATKVRWIKHLINENMNSLKVLNLIGFFGWNVGLLHRLNRGWNQASDLFQYDVNKLKASIWVEVYSIIKALSSIFLVFFWNNMEIYIIFMCIQKFGRFGSISLK